MSSEEVYGSKGANLLTRSEWGQGPAGSGTRFQLGVLFTWKQKYHEGDSQSWGTNFLSSYSGNQRGEQSEAIPQLFLKTHVFLITFSIKTKFGVMYQWCITEL